MHHVIRRAPFLVFLCAIVVTCVFQTMFPRDARDRQGSDYASYYHPTANSLLAGGGYSTPIGSVQTRIPPGYPLLLAAAQLLGRPAGIGDEGAVRLLMVLSMGLGAVVIFLIARMIWGPRSALIPSVLWMTCPFTQFLTLQLNSDVPFMPSYYATVGLFLHAILNGAASPLVFFLTGLLAGVVMLFRPIAIGLGGVLAVLLGVALKGRPGHLRVILAAWILFGNAVAVLPWEAWLYAKTGRFILLSDAGSSTLREGWMFGVRTGQPEGRRIVGEDVGDLMREFASAENGGSPKTILQVLARETRRRPAAVVKLVYLKLARCWYGTDSLRFEPLILLVQSLYLPLLLYAGWRSWRSGIAGRLATLCIGSQIACFWGMAFLVIPLLRYMTPVEGLAFILLPAVLPRSRQVASVPRS